MQCAIPQCSCSWAAAQAGSASEGDSWVAARMHFEPLGGAMQLLCAHATQRCLQCHAQQVTAGSHASHQCSCCVLAHCGIGWQQHHYPPAAAAALHVSLVQALLFEPEAQLSSSGALVVHSGGRTGRSPSDKRLVKEPFYQDEVWWGEGSPNIPTDIRWAALQGQPTPCFTDAGLYQLC